MSFQTNCLFCGKTFTAKRSTARYCSNRCKQANKNKRYGKVRPETELDIIKDALRNLERCDRRELTKFAIEVESVIDALGQFKDRYMAIVDEDWLT